ncbi:hypothetical protein STAS_08263 [Striga asiatica]|uniref:Uncharacterized protein n=1 Tax=Striga asiatica TaxID=4170 RepID=A0A5A7PHT4_STRAF|nr:hypothetical protein STAS_08263 [Striga asiatica]
MAKSCGLINRAHDSINKGFQIPSYFYGLTTELLTRRKEEEASHPVFELGMRSERTNGIRAWSFLPVHPRFVTKNFYLEKRQHSLEVLRSPVEAEKLLVSPANESLAGSE